MSEELFSFNNGAIVTKEPFFVPTLYDTSNTVMFTQFDGKGNVTKYGICDKWNIFSSFFLSLYINNKPLPVDIIKETTIKGRTIRTVVEIEDASISILSFIDSFSNAIYEEIEVRAKKDLKFDLTLSYELDISSYISTLFKSRLSPKVVFLLVKSLFKKHKRMEDKGDYQIYKSEIIEDFYLDFALSFSTPLEENKYYWNGLSSSINLRKGETKSLKLVFSAGGRKDLSFCDISKAYTNFKDKKEEALSFTENIPLPKSVITEEEKSYYISRMLTALSMRKKTKHFDALSAGVNYTTPMRTYFRDGYWTSIPLLMNNSELIKNQIITLCYGIDKSGICSSAVTSSLKPWWGDHYDSPSFFVMLIYDYVRTTGDKSILTERVKERSVIDYAISVIEELQTHTDSTSLIYQNQKWARRDWADNIFREGYITYDEALYYRALVALFKLTGKEEYKVKAEDVKEAINTLLWDEDKGYYVNYKTKDFTEDNLSVDSILLILFDIANEERSVSILDNMEKLLETDWGVMCVYPPYKDNKSVIFKSSLPYNYHNGASWPYWTALYSYAKIKMKREGKTVLLKEYDWELSHGHFTPLEYITPYYPVGSDLQGWSSLGAIIYQYPEGDFFNN